MTRLLANRSNIILLSYPECMQIKDNIYYTIFSKILFLQKLNLIKSISI